MVSKWYNVGSIVDVVLLLFDFAKAFDVVSHHLLDKLRLLGVCNPLTDWISDFVISRFMRVF